MPIFSHQSALTLLREFRAHSHHKAKCISAAKAFQNETAIMPQKLDNLRSEKFHIIVKSQNNI